MNHTIILIKNLKIEKNVIKVENHTTLLKSNPLPKNYIKVIYKKGLLHSDSKSDWRHCGLGEKDYAKVNFLEHHVV